MAHMTTPPPKPSAQRRGIPTAMDDVIAAGMAKEPDRRFATAKGLAEAARAALRTNPGAASGEPGRTADIGASAPLPTVPAGRRSQPRATQQFSQYWPDPEGTGYTPYREDVEELETPHPRRGFGAGRIVLTAAAAAMFTGAFLGALWLSFGENSGGSPSGSPDASTSPDAGSSRLATLPTSPHAINTLPDTDNLGFIGYPGARCDPGNEPAVMARTTLSVLVVCQIGPGNFYYRAVRVSDGASIELANAVRSSAGFDVTNPADGSLRGFADELGRRLFGEYARESVRFNGNQRQSKIVELVGAQQITGTIANRQQQPTANPLVTCSTSTPGGGSRSTARRIQDETERSSAAAAARTCSRSSGGK